MNEVSFNHAKKVAGGFILSPGCKTEVQGLFYGGAIDHDTIPEGWHVYAIRTDEVGDPVTLENIEHCLLNFGGVFMTKEKVKFNAHGISNYKYRSLKGKNRYSYEDREDLRKEYW